MSSTNSLLRIIAINELDPADVVAVHTEVYDKEAVCPIWCSLLIRVSYLLLC